MPLLTAQELKLRLGADDVARLADRDIAAGEEYDAIAAALEDAEAEVLGYVRMVTPAPVPDPAPAVLKRLCATLAHYSLWRRNLPEEHPVYLAYRDAVRELQAIAKGLVALPLPDSQSNAATASAGAVYAPSRHLTDAALAAMLP